MTDDPSRAATDAATADATRAYLQLTERIASPLGAADAMEEPDSLGRIPVLVRVQRQPPVRPIALLVAAGLIAFAFAIPLFWALTVLLVIGAVVAVLVGFVTRLFIRVPHGTVALVARGNRHARTLESGVHPVLPVYALTHLVTTRQIAFDIPVREVRSADGVGVTVDVILTLQVNDPVRFAYDIAVGDLDQLVHAVTLDAVRSLVRGIESLDVLDLGQTEADRLREAVNGRLAPFGVATVGVAFTRVTLPVELTHSLEARRLAAVQVAEQAEAFALEERRLKDRASLMAQEEDFRRAAVEAEAAAEEVRLARLQERVTRHPAAARYDLEVERLKVARRLAKNRRVVVSLAGGELLGDLLTAGEVAETAPPPAGRSSRKAEPPAPTPPA